MQTGRLALLAALLVVAAGGLVLGEAPAEPPPSDWQPPRVVAIEGVDECLNYMHLQWVTGAMEGQPAALFVRDGDLLLVAEELYLVYRAEDGQVFAVESDENPPLVDGQVVSLDGSPEASEWLARASEEQLAAVRLVFADRGLDLPTPEWRAALSRLAEANPHVGCAVEDPEALPFVLETFDPYLLVLPDGALGAAGDTELVAAEPDVRALIANAEDAQDLATLAELPALRKLVLVGWDPAVAGPLPQDMGGLRTLTVFGAELADLSVLQHLTGLRELHLSACVVESLDGLANLSQLRALTLTNCEGPGDLSVLKALPDLEWLGLPASVTQEELERTVAEHPGLRILEVGGCEAISVLTPLTKLERLEALVLLGLPPDYEPLRSMKQLRLLALDRRAFEETPEEVAALREALPAAKIVPAQPFCLGSGWILALPAAVGAFWLVSRLRHGRRGRRVPAHG